ncbi:antitoxin [Calidifontibacter sp. DB0510]|uniref:Antitoxin n=1 Tax=Metallococcus carri TaxID=1656884 RepID=A0A967AZD1_9MICO|nr:antitoxin [Metallococcus carri]NHN54415.1 antitoxin [Metallococcus carri]NOP36746.1 antitoxin [Calidifontibacter sp. DB2511S]
MVNFNNLVNKARDFARKNPDKVRQGLSKAEQAIDTKTGGKYNSQVRSGVEAAEKQLGVQEAQGQPGQPGQPGQQPPATGQ